MKVILSAFQDKLRSEVMDWPGNLPPTISMQLDMSRFTASIFPKRGVFEKKDHYLSGKLNGEDFCACFYELVDVR
jgi:hypothetical protein